jgi:hypothetical protein
MVTVWTPQAITELRKAYDYISKDSPQNARKVLDELMCIADQFPEQPENREYYNYYKFAEKFKGSKINTSYSHFRTLPVIGNKAKKNDPSTLTSILSGLKYRLVLRSSCQL